MAFDTFYHYSKREEPSKKIKDSGKIFYFYKLGEHNSSLFFQITRKIKNYTSRNTPQGGDKVCINGKDYIVHDVWWPMPRMLNGVPALVYITVRSVSSIKSFNFDERMKK